nr:ribonuclease H-like domain-containing protein [Tanacetum cinerariifolium]
MLPLWSFISSTFKSSDDKATDDKPKNDIGDRGRDNGKRPVREEDEKALVVQDRLGTYNWSYQVEEKATDFALMAFTSNPSSSLSLNFKFNEKEMLDVKEEEMTETMFDNRSSDEENSLANDRFKKGEGYHTVPPLLTENYMPPKFDLLFAGLDDSVYKFKISEIVTSLTKDEKEALETSTAFVEKTKEVRTSTPLIQDWNTDSDNDSVFRPTHIPAKIDFIKAVSAVKENGVTAVKTSMGALVTKSYNKTPYELLNGRTPKLDFMRPFGCPVTILNTLDPLGKFKGNQTDKNASPQDTNGNAGTQDNVDAGKNVSDQHYIVLPLWSFISSTFKSSDDKATDDKPKNDIGSKTVEEPVNKED